MGGVDRKDTRQSRKELMDFKQPKRQAREEGQAAGPGRAGPAWRPVYTHSSRSNVQRQYEPHC